jgi:CpXC protein
MSLFKPMNLTCPVCGQENTNQIAGSINADRRPDFRDAIMAGTFQDTTCKRCQHSFRTEPQLNYLDVGRGQWIAAMPGRLMADYLEEEDRAQHSFDNSYGANSTPQAQDIGAGLTPRLTFGWPALREKLLIRDLGLNDVVIEMVKLDLLRRLPDAPLTPGTELRLMAVQNGRMVFNWVDTLSEDARERIELDRALYDAIDRNPDGWAPVRAALSNGMFIDMQKLYMGDGRHAAAG